ncbi:MAG: PQQ-binding-like beta-propeller repeat protein [Planctomycetes bacterium]|nr:PQQ-binding-like beta-propeller repeat protein [Planctomycetota bacterium]
MRSLWGMMCIVWPLLGGCGVGEEVEWAQYGSLVDPTVEAIRAEVASLPLKEEVWSYPFRDHRIARMSLGMEYLYLETPDHRVAAVDRFTGELKWDFQVTTNTPLDWTPTEAAEVQLEVRDLEARIREQARRVEDLKKTEGFGEKTRDAQRRENQLRQELDVARRGDNVYFISRHILYCLVRTTGNLEWTKRLPFPPAAKPFASKDSVFVPAADLSRVWRLEVDRGGESTDMYQTKISGGDRAITASPVFTENRLYFISSDRQAYAYDVVSTDLRWSYKAHDKLMAGPVSYKLRDVYKDASGREVGRVRKHYLLFGGMDGALYALDANTGVLEWKYETAGLIKTPPVVKDETVYVKTDEGSLFALELDPQHLDPKTRERMGTNRMGSLRWKIPAGERFLLKVDGDYILVLGPGSEIYKVTELTGEIVRRTALRELRHVVTNPLDDILYVASDSGYVAAFRESAERR